MSSSERPGARLDRVRHLGTTTPTPEVLGRWYEAYGRRVYRYVRWRVAGREAAEDVVGAVFQTALRRLHTYQPERSAPQTWLFQIARSTVTDHLRQLQRKRHLHVSIDHIHDLVSDLPSPEEQLLYEERVRRLLNAVAELRPTDREVLELRYGGELTLRELAEVLGITESAAAVRAHRALRRLQGRLKQDQVW